MATTTNTGSGLSVSAMPERDRKIYQLTKQCVQCGLCLPHCPTYAIKQHEADSPRGRISLIEGLVLSQLHADETLVEHLEGCVFCRRCETVCPPHVPFGRIMLEARQKLFCDGKTRANLPTWLNLMTKSRLLRRLALLLFGVYVHSGLRGLLQKIHLLHALKLARIDAMLPAKATVGRCSSTPRIKHLGTVALFTGCIAEIFDRETLAAARKLINATGFRVVRPHRQTCCGALHQHSGDKGTAETLLARNAEAFRNTQTLISCASGCGLQLMEYEEHLKVQHVDIHAFLDRHGRKLHFAPLKKTCALHLPCTMQNGLGGCNSISALLSRIPGLKVETLPALPSCCGAAGMYMLSHPQTADALLAEKLRSLQALKADMLLTPNVGCAMHLRQGIAARRWRIEVLHPVSLLCRLLERPGPGRP